MLLATLTLNKIMISSQLKNFKAIHLYNAQYHIYSIKLIYRTLQKCFFVFFRKDAKCYKCGYHKILNYKSPKLISHQIRFWDLFRNFFLSKASYWFQYGLGLVKNKQRLKQLETLRRHPKIASKSQLIQSMSSYSIRES